MDTVSECFVPRSWNDFGLFIECLEVRAAILVSYVLREQGIEVYSSRFDAHPRWPLLMQSLRSQQSYGKIGDCMKTIKNYDLNYQVNVRVINFCCWRF